MPRLATVARLALAVTLTLGLAALPARADPVAMGDQVVVLLWSGASFRGTLESQDERHLVLRSAGGTRRELPLSSVRAVNREVPVGPRAAAVATEDVAASPASATVAATVAGTATDQGASAPQRVFLLGKPPALPYPVRVGVGVSLPASGALPSFSLPVQLAAEFRLEPEIALARERVGELDTTRLQVGLGALFTKEVAPQVGACGGARLQVLRDSGKGLPTETSLRVAAVAGGEWLPVPRVSVGAEAQVAYVKAAKASTSGAGTGFHTAGLLFLRVYLN